MTIKENVQMCIGLTFVFYVILVSILAIFGVISFGFMVMLSIPIFLIFGIGAQIIYGMKF